MAKSNCYKYGSKEQKSLLTSLFSDAKTNCFRSDKLSLIRALLLRSRSGLFA